MSLAEDIKRLSHVPLFDGFSVEQMRLVAFGSKRQLCRRGEVLYHEGALSDGGHVIVSGQVDLVSYRGEQEFILASYRENSLVGELALITENRRTATAVARTDSEFILIPREVFRRMLAEYPDLAGLLYRRINQSVQEMLSGMREVQAKLEATPRLAPEKPAEGRDGGEEKKS